MGRLLGNKYSGDTERRQYDQYLTPTKPVVAVANILKKDIIKFPPETILDPCAGEGIWGQVLGSIFTEARVYGVDIDESLEKPDFFDYWHTGDFIGSHMANKKFDLIVSNPPFKLAEKFVTEAFRHVAHMGVIAYMFPLGFMSSVGRYNRLFKGFTYRPDHIYVSSRRIDFTGQGSPHTDIAMYIWKAEGKGTTQTTIEWFDWEE